MIFPEGDNIAKTQPVWVGRPTLRRALDRVAQIGLALLALICQDANPRSWDEPAHDLDYDQFAMRRLVEQVRAFAGMEVPA